MQTMLPLLTVIHLMIIMLVLQIKQQQALEQNFTIILKQLVLQLVIGSTFIIYASIIPTISGGSGIALTDLSGP